MSAALLDTITRVFRAALASLDPARLVHDALPPLPPRRARVVVIAAGKAAAAMAQGALARWPDRIDRVLVVGPDPISTWSDPASVRSPRRTRSPTSAASSPPRPRSPSPAISARGTCSWR